MMKIKTHPLTGPSVAPGGTERFGIAIATEWSWRVATNQTNTSSVNSSVDVQLNEGRQRNGGISFGWVA